MSVVDGDNQLRYGFPLINEAPSLASSMANKVFILPTILNYAIFFAISFLLTYLFNRFIKPIHPNKISKIIALVFVGCFIAFEIQGCFAFDTLFQWKDKDEAAGFTTKIIDSGFNWEYSKRDSLVMGHK